MSGYAISLIAGVWPGPSHRGMPVSDNTAVSCPDGAWKRPGLPSRCKAHIWLAQKQGGLLESGRDTSPAGPCVAARLFQRASGLSTVRPRSDQGAALPLSLHARLRSPCASSIGVRPTPVSLPLPGRCCLFFIRNHGHSSVHQLPDAGSLESGSLAVDRFATLNRILSLECSAAGHPGVWGRTRSSLFCEAEV